MSARVFAIRPEPGLTRTLEAGRAMGIVIEGHSLAEVRPVAWQAPPDDGFDALLLGSANAVRHAGSALAQWRGRTAHAVGEATAEAARAAGLSVVSVGQGHLQPVLDALAHTGPTRLLRLTGEVHVAVSPPANVSIETRVVYRLIHRAVSPDFAARLARGGIVLLHSGEAARHFSGECHRVGIAREAISLAALAPRIADAAGHGWHRVEIAPQPEDSALLALVRDICH